jgi:CRISPR/Cas system Type II protein with McrA/HNH and RuvC-like nuclease domain
MVYENQEEMNAVLGKIEDNQFIQQELAQLDLFKKEVKKLMKKF